MLILTRRMGESVKIDDDVTVTVLGIKGSHVRLGFTAPKHVAVHREEIYALMQTAPEPCKPLARAASATTLRR